MRTYEIIGYTKTGLYSEIVDATSALVALAKGQKIIKGFRPGKRWSYWAVRPY